VIMLLEKDLPEEEKTVRLVTKEAADETPDADNPARV